MEAAEEEEAAESEPATSFAEADADADVPSPPRGPATPGERTNAAAQLSQRLEERRVWVSGTSAARASGSSSPQPHYEQPGELRVPLRLVVQQCLEDWAIDSDDSEDADDFCGWRVGSRAEPPDGQAPIIAPRQRVPGSGSSIGVRGGGSSSGRPPGRPCLLQ